MRVLLRNLGECFVSLHVKSIAGKNVSLSDKKLWRFLKNFLVAEKSHCKALSIDRHLEMSSFLQKNTETLTFVSLKFCFLGFVNRHNELFFSYLWSFVHKFTSSSTNPRADKERSPTHCSIIIELRLGLFMLRCIYAQSAFIAIPWSEYHDI